MKIITSDKKPHTISNSLISKSSFLSGLSFYPPNILNFPFSQKIILLAEEFSKSDSETFLKNNIFLELETEKIKIFPTIYDVEILEDLINFSNFINYNNLLESCCKNLAEKMNGTVSEEKWIESVIENDMI